MEKIGSGSSVDEEEEGRFQGAAHVKFTVKPHDKEEQQTTGYQEAAPATTTKDAEKGTIVTEQQGSSPFTRDKQRDLEKTEQVSSVDKEHEVRLQGEALLKITEEVNKTNQTTGPQDTATVTTSQEEVDEEDPTHIHIEANLQSVLDKNDSAIESAQDKSSELTEMTHAQVEAPHDTARHESDERNTRQHRY